MPAAPLSHPVPAVIVCPGGGYHFRAPHEAGPFAEFFAADLHVTEENPPVFLFTADDPVVPVSHSLLFAQACLAKGVLVELRVYQSGRHGVGLARDLPKLASWPELMIDWLAGWGD